MEFHQTKMGHIFFEHQLPSLIKVLERIADAVTNSPKADGNKCLRRERSINPGNDYWVCFCGHSGCTPSSDGGTGFIRCDDSGNRAVDEYKWPGLYQCPQCGRIFDIDGFLS